MMCELCKQSQATVHLTEIVNEQMAELHLCESCANEKGAQVESHFGLADLLGGLADLSKSEEPEEVSGKMCPNCKMTYDEFRKVGRLGCGECYTAFRGSLASLLKRIHGSPHHIGKSPARSGKATKAKSELSQLRRKLERVIEAEEFEEAARLRDAIRQMEQSEVPSKPGRHKKS